VFFLQTNGSGVLSFASSSGGKVLQVVAGTTVTSTVTTSSSYVATNLSASITPSLTSSKVLVLLSGVGDIGSSGNEVEYSLFRNASNIITGGGSLFANHYNSGARDQTQITYNYLDSPSSTSSLEYKVYFKSVGSVTSTFVGENATASMILLEIGA